MKKKNATLLSSANTSKKLKLFPIPPCPYLKDSSYLQILLYSSENTKSKWREIQVLKCETEGQRRQAGNEGLAHLRLWTEPIEFSRSTLQLKKGTKGGKASKEENMTRRQRAELVQSEGFGEAKATHHRDEKVTVSGQGASLKSITKFFATREKAYCWEPISDFTVSSVRCIFGNVVSVMCTLIEYG